MPGHPNSSKIGLRAKLGPLGASLGRKNVALLKIQLDNQSQSNTAVGLPPLAVSALMKGQKIEAIKIVREERGIELTEAKDVVEEYIRSDPIIQAELKIVRRYRNRFGWILLLIVLGILARYFLAN